MGRRQEVKPFIRLSRAEPGKDGLPADFAGLSNPGKRRITGNPGKERFKAASYPLCLKILKGINLKRKAMVGLIFWFLFGEWVFTPYTLLT
jgi:hypothetical protein